MTAIMGGQASRDRDPGHGLGALLGLGGPMQARLTATVAAAWRERLRDGTASADAAAVRAARPALHAALYGRVVATLRAWTGRPDLPVTLTMVPEAAPPALARDGDGMAAELPFGWISDVWARGLGTCWDQFCLAAEPAGDGWTLSAVAPDLGPPSHVTSAVPRPADQGPATGAPARDRLTRLGHGSSACVPGGRACGRTAGRPAPGLRPPPPEPPLTSDGDGNGRVPREPAGAGPGRRRTVRWPDPGAPSAAAVRRRPSATGGRRPCTPRRTVRGPRPGLEATQPGRARRHRPPRGIPAARPGPRPRPVPSGPDGCPHTSTVRPGRPGSRRRARCAPPQPRRRASRCSSRSYPPTPLSSAYP